MNPSHKQPDPKTPVEVSLKLRGMAPIIEIAVCFASGIGQIRGPNRFIVAESVRLSKQTLERTVDPGWTNWMP